jgi:hypothetical protein
MEYEEYELQPGDGEAMQAAQLEFTDNFFELMKAAAYKIIVLSWHPAFSAPDDWSYGALSVTLRKIMEAASNKAWFKVVEPVDGYDDFLHPCFKREYLHENRKVISPEAVIRTETDLERERELRSIETQYPEVVGEFTERIAEAALTPVTKRKMSPVAQRGLTDMVFINQLDAVFDFDQEETDRLMPGEQITLESLYREVLELGLREFAKLN